MFKPVFADETPSYLIKQENWNSLWGNGISIGK